MRYYFMLFILFLLSFNFYFYTQYSKKIDSIHKNKINLVQKSLSAAANTFALANNNFHSNQSDTIAFLVHQANGKSKNERDIIRDKLLSKFMLFYSDKKLDSFNGMHFFDKDGNSLLRFHELKKYDDAIIKKRFSLQNMYTNFTYQEGLELGVYKESFRFQYPLFYDGSFVGAYEYSISYNNIMREMRKFYADKSILLLKAKSLEEIITPEVLAQNFKKIELSKSSFYYRKSLYNGRFEAKHLEHLLSNKALQNYLNSDVAGVIDYKYKNKENSLVVLPVEDIEKKHIAYILADVKDEESSSLFWALIVQMLLSSISLIFIYLFVRKKIKNRAYVRDLINIQHDMLIVTDGKYIKDANKAFLEFFQYKKIQSFLNEHACVCDFFIIEDGFLQKEKNGVDWLSHIKDHPNESHLVKMLNKKSSEIVIFELESEVLKNSGYSFVLFRDITKATQEKRYLENRAYYDGLTSIYNRNRFEYFLNKEIEKSARYENVFSLIMFDIDHFKEVNDTYGHDVGDSVLKELSALVSDDIRDIDIFARWGGEEFMIISHTSIEKSEAFAEKLRKTIENHIFTEVGRVSCSFGITQYHEDDTKETIVKRCDEMLYSAKRSGRNCVVSLR